MSLGFGQPGRSDAPARRCRKIELIPTGGVSLKRTADFIKAAMNITRVNVPNLQQVIPRVVAKFSKFQGLKRRLALGMARRMLAEEVILLFILLAIHFFDSVPRKIRINPWGTVLESDRHLTRSLTNGGDSQ